jgi:hypothetical protein
MLAAIAGRGVLTVLGGLAEFEGVKMGKKKPKLTAHQIRRGNACRDWPQLQRTISSGGKANRLPSSQSVLISWRTNQPEIEFRVELSCNHCGVDLHVPVWLETAHYP